MALLVVFGSLLKTAAVTCVYRVVSCVPIQVRVATGGVYRVALQPAGCAGGIDNGFIILPLVRKLTAQSQPIKQLLGTRRHYIHMITFSRVGQRTGSVGICLAEP